jgi:hypothetical protein
MKSPTREIMKKIEEEIATIKINRRDLKRFHMLQSKLEVKNKRKMKQQEVMEELISCMEDAL